MTQPTHHASSALLTPTDPVHAAKATLRAQVRAQRSRYSAEQRHADAAGLARTVLELPEVMAATCVCAYASMSSEPGTDRLRAALTAAGVRVLLPVVNQDGTLDWADDHGPLQRPAARLGGPEPAGPRLGPGAIGAAQVLLIPALAVDTLGHRLGQGAGYYDRSLALTAHTASVVAIVHEAEVLDAAVEPVPVQPHDRPVHIVATPRRCLRITSRPGAARGCARP